MDLKRLLSEQMDRSILSGLTNSVSAAPPQEPITLGHLQRMALKMPKRQTWLSTRRSPPNDNAFKVEASGEDFMVAHPSFWMQLGHYCSRDMAPRNADLLGLHRPLFGIDIIEIDEHPSDSEDRLAYIAGIWSRLIDAIKVASTPLPEWLRAAPKFGKHG